LAAPVHFGFGPEDFTPSILVRAALEGHILNLYEGYRLMNLEPSEILLTGGLTQSAAWCQTIADIFATEAVPVKGEGAALGAALHAAWVWGKATEAPQDLAHIVAPFVILDESRRARPRETCRQVVRLQRRLFHCLSRRLRGEEAEDPFPLRHDLRTLSG
jgi:xylulokinase